LTLTKVCRTGPPAYVAYSLAGQYDNPMPESTISPSQGLRIGLQAGIPVGLSAFSYWLLYFCKHPCSCWRLCRWRHPCSSYWYLWRFSIPFVPDVLTVAGVYAIVGFPAVFVPVAASAPVVFCVHFASFLAIAGVQHTIVTLHTFLQTLGLHGVPTLAGSGQLTFYKKTFKN
jgi:hypothetical protein